MAGFAHQVAMSGPATFERDRRQSVSATSETAHTPITAGNDSAAFKEVRVAAAVGAIGVAMAFAGAIAFMIRFKLAETFLGAHIWFNVPVTEADAQKVLSVTIQTFLATGWGLLTAVVAFGFAFMKWMQMQATAGRR
jgi:hypothetical protein